MTDSLEARARRAERAALLSVGLTMFVIVAASGLLIVDRASPPPTPSAVSWRAEQFVLIDGDGATRGSWEVGPEGPYLSVVGRDGHSRAVIVAMDTGPAVLLYDGRDTMRARMALGEEQVAIDVWDEAGNQRAVLSAIGPVGVVGVSDGAGGGNATLTASEGSRLLTVSDDAGEPAVQLGFAEGETVFSTGE